MSWRALACGLLWLVLCSWPACLDAATFVVTKEADENGPCEPDDCALREAVLAANALPGKDRIEIPAGVYHLSLTDPAGGSDPTLGSLIILDSVDILGDPLGEVVIVGEEDRVFFVIDSEVFFSRLTITGGRPTRFGIGAGIQIGNSQVRIEKCLIHDNFALNESGGGVYAFDSRVDIVDSAIVNNSATFDAGGIVRFGIFPTVDSTMTLINTTVSGNSADQGGGIRSGGFGDLILINSTIADNFARIASAVLMIRQPGPIWSNTIVHGTCFFDLGARTTSLGGNLESPGSTCFLTDPTDRMGVADLGLGPLTQTPSSPTPFHPLFPGSPAIDSAIDAECPATDQRGRGRPIDGDGDGVARCDSGSYEAAAPVADIPVLGPWCVLFLAACLGLLGFRRARLDLR